jgi:hypothetical protein
MLRLVFLVPGVMLKAFRSRRDLVFENLLRKQHH